VDLLSVIRRWHGRDKLPIREIARRTGLSRNTIRKYLANGEVTPAYPARKSVSKLDPFAETLLSWLTREAKRSRKRRRNLKQLHRDLVALGFDGSYDRVAAFARDWRQRERERANRASRGAFVPLVFAPGEAFQFDWSEDWIRIGGKKTKLQMAHFKLCHSRAFFLRAYLTQTHEMLFDAHNHAFRVLQGIPERGIYDNMKTAVDKVGRGKHRVVNARFRAMVSHFLFESEFCNPAAGWEKGQVEKNVRDARHRLLQDAPAFTSLDDLNDWLEERCQSLWHEVMHPEQSSRSVAEVFDDERGALMATPPPFDGFVELTKRVTPTCLIVFERNRYSVPAAFANRVVSMRAYADRIVLVAEADVMMSLPSMCGSSTAITTARAQPFTTGAIIWPWCRESPVRSGTAHRLPSYQRASSACGLHCTSAMAAIARWPTSWRWCCITTRSLWNRRFVKPLPAA
jgi:transposase